MTKKIKRKIKVFITGGNGFVGSNLVRTCIKRKYDVHVLLRQKQHVSRLQEILPFITVHNGDLSDKNKLRRIVTNINPTYIFHLAAYGAYPTQNNLEKCIKTNIDGTKNLLLATKDIPYKCFVNTGSSSEYGRKSLPMKETDICNPESYYAFTKLAATHLCKLFAKEYNKPIVTLRLFSVYGQLEKSTRFIPTIIHNLLVHKPILLTPGKQRRDFIFVDDVTAAYLAAAKKGKQVTGEILNIGTGKEYSNDEVVSCLFTTVNKSTVVQKGAYPKRTWDTTHWVADTSNTKKKLTWKPKFTLDKGLALTYAWYKKRLRNYETTEF